MYRAKGIRAELDSRSEKVGYKIREAQLEKVPYIAVVGEKEAETGTVSVTVGGKRESTSYTAEEFMNMMLEDIAARKTEVQ